jgi:abortive infection bacteriophage resistance protein
VQKAGFPFLGRKSLMAAPKIPFTKQASTPEALLAKLKADGLEVEDSKASVALDYLRGVGGYRLKGYWYHLVDPVTKKFPPQITFDHVIAQCEFDRELRTATISAIERLEVAIRAVMANYLSLKHSPHWFLDKSIFKPTQKWGMGHLIRKIEGEVDRSKEKRFIKHYFDNHDDPYLPPSWAISECVTFGLWSRTYAILRDNNDQKAIAMKFGVEEPDVFRSWIHNLTVVRNTAAHHGQILRAKLGVTPADYKKHGIRFHGKKEFFCTATAIQYLLVRTRLPNSWLTDLDSIFAKYPTVSISEIGFPSNWKTLPGWETEA